MNRMSRRSYYALMATLVLAGVIALAMAAGTAFSAGTAILGKPGWWNDQEQVSNTIAEQQIPAVPYPASQMRDSLERRNLRERLLRFNRPDKVGYLYLTSFGKFVGYYVIKGKVSSNQSQMTNTQQTWEMCCHSGSIAVDSIGDDGSFGPNEGGDRGVFFFTSTGVMVETTLDWVYSDAPLHIDVPNLLSKKK